MQRKCLNWKMPAPGAMPMSAWAWLNSMPTKTWVWHAALAALLMLATAAGTGRADSPLAKPDLPQPLPENIVAAWKAAGAEVGWMRLFPAENLNFVLVKEGKLGDLPAFRFARGQEGRWAKLPDPAQAFGLFLADIQVTDASFSDASQKRFCAWQRFCEASKG